MTIVRSTLSQDIHYTPRLPHCSESADPETTATKWNEVSPQSATQERLLY